MKNKPLVFLPDDNITVNGVMIQRFEKLGCRAKSFTNPEELIVALDKYKPQLILVDINLGGDISGFDVIRAIREKMQLEIPILVVSGDQNIERVALALEIGANDYLVKPPLRIPFKETVTKYLYSELYENSSKNKFQFIGPDRSALKITFPVEILEIQPYGFVISSPHLIKKGTMLHFRGDSLKKIAPNCENIFATVVNTTMQIESEKKTYRVQIEIDDSQTEVLEDFRSFLSKKSVEHPK